MMMTKNKNTKIGGNKLIRLDDCSSVKTIYIVKYNEIHHMPDSNSTRNNTYNLFTFENLDMAKGYMDSAYKNIVSPYVVSGNFKIMFSKSTDELLPEPNGSKVLYKRCVKIIGDKDTNKCQTRFFTFTVETINFRATK